MDDPRTPRRLVGIAEVETLLGRRPGSGRRTVNRLLARGAFPVPTWVGGRRGWYEDEIAAWLESQRRPSLKASP